MRSISFIGAGNMAFALAKAFSAGFPNCEFIFADPSPKRRELVLSSLNRAVFRENNKRVAEQADVLFIAVKPQTFDSVLPEITGYKGLLISIAAGITIDRIKGRVPGARIVRVMPNTPCLVGEMAAGYALDTSCTARDEAIVQALLTEAGTACRVTEEQMDAVTALSGSGPAFIARLIEGFIQSGINAGLPENIARDLTLRTFSGTARQLMEQSITPQQLVEMVSSPGGTTVAGREALEASNYQEIIDKTITRAVKRSRELGQ